MMIAELYLEGCIIMCGFLGIISKERNVSFDLYNGLLDLQHRGQDSFGFVTYDTHKRGNVNIHKNLGLIADNVNTELLSYLEGNWGIAQVRYPTVGNNSIDDRRRDAQPTYVSTPGFAMAHNGNIVNFVELREELQTCRRYPKSKCDVEVINLLLAEEASKITMSEELTKNDLFEATKRVMKKLKGSYSVVAIVQDVGFIAFRDPYAIRPFVIGKNEKGDYAFASESVAFDKIGYKILRDMKGGEAVFYPVDGKGEDDLESRVLVNGVCPRHCSFEYVYFARPSSKMNGIDVYQKRKELGKYLAYQFKKEHPELLDVIDVVGPIPDSPRPIAEGFAEALGLRHVELLDKNRYAKRTFIKPTQEERQKEVFGKNVVIVPEVKGKNVFIVDDSLVRGNTSKIIIAKLRDAGARRVDVGIGSPPIRYSCQLGIDTPSEEELTAHNKDVEQVRKIIGADTLTYISFNNFRKAMELGTNGMDLCYGCMNHKYPVECSNVFSDSRVKDRGE
jgi:amidophosphoribosyltransferase